jgi:hypothetical protein
LVQLTGGSFRTSTLVPVNEIRTETTVLTRIATALIDLFITVSPGITVMTATGEVLKTIKTRPIMAVNANTIIDVCLTVFTSES